MRDSLIMDAKVVANETITNSAVYLVLGMAGVPDMIYSSDDNSVVSALKSGVLASAVNVSGAKLREMYPVLNVFG